MNSDKTQALMESTDKLIQKALRKAGAHPPCKAGCFWCCKEPVYCSSSEVRHLLGLLSEDQKKALADRVSDWAFKFQRSPFIEMIEPNVHEYRRMNLFCPLLDDGLCSVYERRPVACRMHLVKSDPHRCESDELRKKQLFLNFKGLAETQIPQIMSGIEENQTEKMDHLGLLLFEELFGVEKKSKARVVAKFEGTTLVVEKYKDDEEVPGVV